MSSYTKGIPTLDYLKACNDTHFLIDNTIWRRGEPHHKVSKCRVDRDVSSFVKHRIVDDRAELPSRLIVILRDQYVPDRTVIDDSGKLIGISTKLWTLYRDKDTKHYVTNKGYYVTSLNNKQGKRIRKSFKDLESTLEWISQAKEEYREDFTKLNLLSYFNN